MCSHRNLQILKCAILISVYRLFLIVATLFTHEYKPTCYSLFLYALRENSENVRRCNSVDYLGGGLGKTPDGCLMGQNSGTRDLACATWVKLMVPYNILYTPQVLYTYTIPILLYYIYEKRLD